jgi:hypothetical protein
MADGLALDRARGGAVGPPGRPGRQRGADRGSSSRRPEAVGAGHYYLYQCIQELRIVTHFPLRPVNARRRE